MIITVTWMDGKQEIYKCEDYKVIDGVLWLERTEDWRPMFCIPYDVNVRHWSVDPGRSPK
jgi:hypothetical protein